MRLLLVVPALALMLGGCATPPAHPTSIVQPREGSSTCHVLDGKADRACTPGVLNPKVTQVDIATTICRRGWTATVRPPAEYTETLKRQQMLAYGETGGLSGYEEDHLVPLELGGAPSDRRNLWPEPRAGANGAADKDQEEYALNRAVCNQRMTLRDARTKIVADWTH